MTYERGQRVVPGAIIPPPTTKPPQPPPPPGGWPSDAHKIANEHDVQLVARAIAPEFPGAGQDPNYRDDAARVLAALAERGMTLAPAVHIDAGEADPGDKYPEHFHDGMKRGQTCPVCGHVFTHDYGSLFARAPQAALAEMEDPTAGRPPMPPAEFLAAVTMVGERAAAGYGWQEGYLAGRAAAAADIRDAAYPDPSPCLPAWHAGYTETAARIAAGEKP